MFNIEPETTKINKETTVDLLQVNEFTPEHIQITKELYENHWKKFYPELYGDKLPTAIKFLGFELIPCDNYNLGEQKNREGGASRKKKSKAIKQNIERNGYKLKYPPISWFRHSSNIDGMQVITGDTRGQILAEAPFVMKNRIVAVYIGKEGYSKEEIEDAIDSCGLRFNAIHDPADPLSTGDVRRTVTRAVSRYIDTNGKAGVANTIDEITKRVDYVCGEGIFQPATRQNLVFEIYNNFNPDELVISWSDVASAKYRISSFLTKNKFVDTDTVKYIFNSSETPSKAFTRACKIAAENPKAEVRLMLHTGTLSGYCLSTTFKKRIQSFISEFDNIKTSVKLASDEGASFSRISIYGCLPALGAYHDVEVPFVLNRRTGKFYQKTNEYSFDMDAE